MFRALSRVRFGSRLAPLASFTEAAICRLLPLGTLKPPRMAFSRTTTDHFRTFWVDSTPAHRLAYLN